MSIRSKLPASAGGRFAVLAAVLAAFGLAGCGGNDSDPITSFSGQVFSNGASRGRAAEPLAGASVTVTHFTTGEVLASATSDPTGKFTASVRTLPPGTLLRITATANAGGSLSIHALVPMPRKGGVVRADPETTIAYLGIARLVAAGTPKALIDSEVFDQALNAVRSAATGGLIDLDAVDFRDSEDVDAALDAAMGPTVLVTSNARAKVFVDDVDTGRYVPYLATRLTPGGHLFRVETSTRASETSASVETGAAAWVDITVISGGGAVPTTANYGGSMVFTLNDEIIQSPASGVSVREVPGFPDKRFVTISLSGVNEFPLNRAVLLNVTADVTGPDTLAGTAGTESGSFLRADFVASAGTITQFSEEVQAGVASLTFNSDGTVSFSVNANGTLLTGTASGTLPRFGP
ncbi:MAG: carboxypeptidase regulatory-like domain-containing protein [Fimbriimonadia bacterium]|jgi:hypothetical protein